MAAAHRSAGSICLEPCTVHHVLFHAETKVLHSRCSGGEHGFVRTSCNRWIIPCLVHLACSGQEICNLYVLPDCPILYLKQHLLWVLAISLCSKQRHLDTGHHMGWCPQEIGVLLASRRSDSGQALSTAIQNQDHSKIIKILEAGQNPDCLGEVQGRRRMEPVFLKAAAAGFFYSVHLLLNGFADPNIAGNDRRTASCSYGSLAN